MRNRLRQGTKSIQQFASITRGTAANEMRKAMNGTHSRPCPIVTVKNRIIAISSPVESMSPCQNRAATDKTGFMPFILPAISGTTKKIHATGQLADDIRTARGRARDRG